ncbi:MAG: hypothetical protein AAB665_04040 [Patescibacteria group bacterium]
MTKTLEKAFSEAALLDKDAQDHIGRELLVHVQKFQQLRRDIQAGVRSLNTGRVVTIDSESVIKRAHRRHAKTKKRTR